MASVEVASQAINVKRKRRRKRMDEFEIDWIPEDTGAPYEADECFNDVPAHTIDKICKSKYGHTNCKNVTFRKFSICTNFNIASYWSPWILVSTNICIKD